MDWERCYREIARLLETMPLLEYRTATSTNVVQWLGRAYALVAQVNDGADNIMFKTAASNLATANWIGAVHDIKTIVYRAWAVAESRAPPGIAGAFIPAGGDFDAFVAVGRVFETAATDLMIIDPYMDHVVLSDFATTAREGVQLRLLTDQATIKATLQPAAKRWTNQHGAKRPLAVRVAPPRALHDRAFFVDGATVWLVSQSLKDLAARAHSTIAKADAEVAAAKVAAYEALWVSAAVLV